MRLYLIGLPGCGKSSLGKKLAHKLGYEFIDMDEYIEQKAMMFIEDIFDSYGEKYFRALETNILKDFLQLDNVIIATGGGVIKDLKNKKLMDGVVVWLDAPIEVIQKRCDESEIVRPLLQTKTVYILYLERKDLYEKFADIKVLNEDMDLAISDIINYLNNN